MLLARDQPHEYRSIVHVDTIAYQVEDVNQKVVNGMLCLSQIVDIRGRRMGLLSDTTIHQSGGIRIDADEVKAEDLVAGNKIISNLMALPTAH